MFNVMKFNLASIFLLCCNVCWNVCSLLAPLFWISCWPFSGVIFFLPPPHDGSKRVFSTFRAGEWRVLGYASYSSSPTFLKVIKNASPSMFSPLISSNKPNKPLKFKLFHKKEMKSWAWGVTSSPNPSARKVEKAHFEGGKGIIRHV